MSGADPFIISLNLGDWESGTWLKIKGILILCFL
jgi:hypothetical protein